MAIRLERLCCLKVIIMDFFLQLLGHFQLTFCMLVLALLSPKLSCSFLLSVLNFYGLVLVLITKIEICVKRVVLLLVLIN